MPDGQAQEHPQDVAAPQAPPPAGSSLFDRLRELGQTLNPSEIPGGAEIGHVLGALLKTVEHDGLKVADELFPEPTVAQPVGSTGSPAAPDPRVSQHDERLQQVEAGLSQIIELLKKDEQPLPGGEPQA